MTVLWNITDDEFQPAKKASARVVQGNYVLKAVKDSVYALVRENAFH